MKKKLLSLLMAGVIVTGTAVQANAQTETVISEDGSPITAPITVKGAITKKSGDIQDGRIQVEVPTALSFVVNENGDLIGQSFEIKNTGSVDVEVSVNAFHESIDQGGINVLAKGMITEDSKRNDVYLELYGDETIDLANKEQHSKKLATVTAGGGIKTITLRGEAGKNIMENEEIENNGIDENFTLVLEIKKSELK